MAVPKTKISKSRRGQRRAHDAISSGTYHECQDTGELKLRHHVSPDGWYRGRQVIKPKVSAPAVEEAPAQS
ncbi:MAG: 50S ribosomal protein L32 [Alphaproteobacteria bacterium]|nr:50S ribosomal protein L32 [Alphaproteobacteria bacterium]MDD9919949.1 50S ribosomal protein L32 [Alphaproteobacteria bacterium]